MTTSEVEHEFDEIVRAILRSPDNLASPAELRQQVAVAWRAFQGADKDQSNTISVDEVQELANRLGLPISEDAETAMLELDTDLSGVIEPVEFMRWYGVSGRAQKAEEGGGLIGLHLLSTQVAGARVAEPECGATATYYRGSDSILQHDEAPLAYSQCAGCPGA